MKSRRQTTKALTKLKEYDLSLQEVETPGSIMKFFAEDVSGKPSEKEINKYIKVIMEQDYENVIEDVIECFDYVSEFENVRKIIPEDFICEILGKVFEKELMAGVMASVKKEKSKKKKVKNA